MGLSDRMREQAIERGKVAGSWVIDATTSAKQIARLVQGYREGDPAAYDVEPAWLSGEWAGESIPELFEGDYRLTITSAAGVVTEYEVASLEAAETLALNTFADLGVNADELDELRGWMNHGGGLGEGTQTSTGLRAQFHSDPDDDTLTEYEAAASEAFWREVMANAATHYTFDIEAIVGAYAECALWSTTWADEEGDEPRPLDEDYSVDDIDPATMEAFQSDCVAFVEANTLDLIGLSDQTIGHNFWLTREGHGAGFWDLGLEERGTRLSDAAKVYGTTYLYVEEGKVKAN